MFPSSEIVDPEVNETATIELDNGLSQEVADKQVIAEFSVTATESEYNDFIALINGKGYRIVGQIPDIGGGPQKLDNVLSYKSAKMKRS